MSELYRLDSSDENILLAAGLLLQKLAASRTIRPAQLVTVAKLQHILSVLPRVTTGVTASVSVCCPRHKFGDIETFHWWDFEVEEEQLRISSGGHFYRPSTGGDTFTTMTWGAIPEELAELNDYRESLGIVPDVCSFPEGVASIDFESGGYSVEILDDDNPLLEEQQNEEVEDENATVEADVAPEGKDGGEPEGGETRRSQSMLPVVSPEYSFRDFCQKILGNDPIRVLDLASAEITYTRQNHRDRTKDRDFRKGSRGRAYCDDLQQLISLLMGSAPETVSAGFFDAVKPLALDLLQRWEVLGLRELIGRRAETTPPMKEPM
jgi:hypothetical protein